MVVQGKIREVAGAQTCTRTHRRASLRRSLTTSLTKGAVLFAGIAAFVIPSWFFGGFDVAPPATDEEVMAIRPHAPNSPAALVERHGCWTGEAPADMVGELPGHVVVSEVGKGPRHAGPAMVGKALAQIFEGADHGLTVHAFCR